ncbi:hypothetical protein ACIRTB_12410 [Streptomyces sp. NPDC101158]|uniref:hypothetical protein n=1 Tax=Streptomyces sp. NPDC101158 TaxID=3366117 RepID=UPI0038277C76
MGEASLRRAQAFIEASADKPITITDIADITDIAAAAAPHRAPCRTPSIATSTRPPPSTCAASAWNTPTGTWRPPTPPPGPTVKQIAARWGLRHPGNFAVLYHRTYGHTPSRTLLG